MTGRYVRRIVHRDGEVIVTLSCGHQVRFTGYEWYEHTRIPSPDEGFFCGEYERGERNYTPKAMPCEECRH